MGVCGRPCLLKKFGPIEKTKFFSLRKKNLGLSLLADHYESGRRKKYRGKQRYRKTEIRNRVLILLSLLLSISHHRQPLRQPPPYLMGALVGRERVRGKERETVTW